MNAINKTHYRKAFHSPYLSSADITEPTVLTISHVSLEQDKTKKTRDLFNTAFFVEKEIRKGEPLKPMVLNATNSKMLATIAQSHFLEDWKNIQVVVQVHSGIKFGRETVDGLRIARVNHAQQNNTIPDGYKVFEDEHLSVLTNEAQYGSGRLVEAHSKLPKNEWSKHLWTTHSSNLKVIAKLADQALSSNGEANE